MNLEASESRADAESFYREEARALRELCARLTGELRLTRRVLNHLLPPAGRETLAEVSAAVRLPTNGFAGEDGDVRFTLDSVETGPTRTRLRGWALAPGLDCGAAFTLLIFAGNGGFYAVPTESEDRPDVGAAFAGSGLADRPERAGFVGAVFHPSIPPGEYMLFLHVEQTGIGAARKDTGVRVTF